jgi:hypothetical protein
VLKEPLEKWLRLADEAAGSPPPLAGNLAEGVRRLAARRRRRAVLGGLGLAAAACVAAVALLRPPAEGPRPAPGPVAEAPKAPSDAEIARLRRELAQVRGEADSRSRVARALIQMERHAQLSGEIQRAPVWLDPLEPIRREADKAARTVLCQADRMACDPARQPAAAEKYREVSQLFPQSFWADVARQKLSQMENRSKV